MLRPQGLFGLGQRAAKMQLAIVRSWLCHAWSGRSVLSEIRLHSVLSTSAGGATNSSAIGFAHLIVR